IQVFPRVSRLLDGGGVEYAFFKSLRPYREATVDLDILIFGDHLPIAVEVLEDGGYDILEDGGLSTTLYDRDVHLNLDLYDEIGVSRIVYLDKDRLRNFTAVERLGDGIEVRSLDAKADLIAVLTHSVIKEQLYVLSEYFTTLGLIARIRGSEIDDFVNLVIGCNVEIAVSTHLQITAYLHNCVYGFVPKELQRVVESLKSHTKEAVRLARNRFEMPHRYGSITLAKSLTEKLAEPKARRSVISQSLGMLNPQYGARFLRAALQHLTRESY
ncbi:MAG: hypothetical protein KAW09_08370, partial [Thermoplasmata archaeon]|nr:hypothetical protein [Thermoplasmata archaeon]